MLSFLLIFPCYKVREKEVHHTNNKKISSQLKFLSLNRLMRLILDDVQCNIVTWIFCYLPA